MSANSSRYHPISRFYLERFGGPTQKVPVAVVDTCPNRLGLRGMRTCSFCDVWGSAAYNETMKLELAEQIQSVIRIVQPRRKLAQNHLRYLVYFQAYTNSFAKVQTLRGHFETALQVPGVCGIVVGTRPDCLSQGVLELWQHFHERAFVGVELGVQSFDEESLRFLRRGHTARDSFKAIERIRRHTTVDLGIHLIFGLPEETDESIVRLAGLVSGLDIDNVKLHNLHVLKNTELELWYKQKLFTPISLEDYKRRVCLFLQHLHPRIAVHRLVATASRWDELVAPDWAKDRMRSHQAVIDELNARDAFQGQLWQPQRDPSLPSEHWAADSTATKLPSQRQAERRSAIVPE